MMREVQLGRGDGSRVGTPLLGGWLVVAAAVATLIGCGPDKHARRAGTPTSHVASAATAATEAPLVSTTAAPAEPKPSAEPELPAAPSPESEAVEVVSVDVKGDRPLLVVRGEGRTPIVYLHGRCGDPTAFKAWAHTGRRFGTIVSLTGDKKCKHSTRTQWSEDTAALDRRVTKALAAVEKELGIELDKDRRIVVGYSQGSLKAEALAARFPKRYPRAVLIAGPRAPRDGALRKTESVLLMAGDRDARDHLREAVRKLGKQHTPAKYVELPGARHGEYGNDAERTMDEALNWLVSTPSPLGA
ncbi:MAG: hypothetical protein HOW73_23330 [Polyangiaceae bacterium]|nr:hypothetical protein [Polyangiaceae bacterium]